jgi:mRNA-degrading endonuclease RelE of RelBE toxin-antitoxin system
LGAGVASFVVLALLPTDHPFTDRDILATLKLDEGLLGASIQDRWRKRSEKRNVLLGFLMIPMAAAFLGGLIILVLDLFSRRAVNVFALVLVFAPVVIFAVYIAIDTVLTYAYYSRVGHLRKEVASRLSATHESHNDHVALSSAEVSEIVTVQDRNMSANIQRGIKQHVESGDSLYSILLDPDAQAALRTLDIDEQAELLDQIDVLQHEPRPDAATVDPDQDTLVLGSGPRRIRYRVDDSRHRVTVLQVGPVAQRPADAG